MDAGTSCVDFDRSDRQSKVKVNKSMVFVVTTGIQNGLHTLRELSAEAFHIAVIVDILT